jgi:hypothetical protein
VKSKYISVPVKDNPVCALTKGSGITSYEGGARQRPRSSLARQARTIMLYGIPKILNAFLDFPCRWWPATRELRYSLSGEPVSWRRCWGLTIRSTWRKAIESGDVNVCSNRADSARSREGPAIDMANRRGRQLFR